MARTKKVQVTLEDGQYEQLAEIARQQGKKMAAVVRESIERYCLEPETDRKRRRALEALLALEAAPVPDDYSEWKRRYGRLKTEGDKTEGERSDGERGEGKKSEGEESEGDKSEADGAAGSR